MRGGRSLLVLLLLAAGLGAYIYFVESRRDPAGATTRDRLFTVEAANINELEIRASSSETTTLRKTNDTWALTAPVSTPADTSTVESLVSGLASIEIERALDDNPTALAPFGLEVPRLEVSFKTTAGTSHRLQIGNTTPTRSGVYARVDDNPRLLLIPAYHEQTFDKTPFDLRDRRALTISRDAVDRVTLAARGGTSIELRREGTNWRLTAPLTARADFSPADGLVSRLSTVQMSSVVSEGAEPTADELRSYGLDTPQLVATVGAGSNTATLALGGARDDASIYARDLSRPLVFTVDASVLTDLRKDPVDLRVKDVFDLNAFSALTLEVTRGATDVAYAKTVPGAGDSSAPTWSRTRPEAGDVNQTALTDLLNTLSSLRADRFVTQMPSSGDDIVVAARFGPTGAPSEERVTLRKSGQTAYAIRAGEPGAAVIPAEQFDTVVSQLNTLTSVPAGTESGGDAGPQTDGQ